MRSGVAELYGHAPVWAQHVLCSLEGLRLRWQRFPPGFAARLAEACARSQWSTEQLAAHRLVRLRAILVHAGRTVPYWRELFASIGFVPERVQHVDELEALPLLTKDVVVREAERMRAERLPHGIDRDAIVLQTSGTTGAGLRLHLSPVAIHEQWAVCWRYRRWHGIEPGTWCGQLGGRVIVAPDDMRGPFHRINVVGRQVLMSSYHLGPTTAPAYLRVLRDRALPWIHGYPSMVAALADAAHDTGIELPALRWVTLASESVGPAQRDRIVRGFGVLPRQHYAQLESVANISECPLGRLHVDEDHACVELVPHVRDAAGRMLHRIVGTSLDNWHEPLLRYDTGDLVALDEHGSCECGRPGRLVADIDGRREDLLVTKSGAVVGRIDHVFKGLEFVCEAQIRQREPGRIAIHVVPRGPWSPSHEDRLRDEVRARLGADTAIAIVLERQLPRGPAGKLRLVVREG